MKTKIEIIDETVEYYSHPNRRATSGRSCEYLTEDGRMCAVGRLVKNVKAFQKRNSNTTIGVCINQNTVRFKKEYSGHGANFWSSLQWLHDNDDFWKEGGGLTITGELHVKYLKNEALDN